MVDTLRLWTPPIQQCFRRTTRPLINSRRFAFARPADGEFQVGTGKSRLLDAEPKRGGSIMSVC